MNQRNRRPVPQSPESQRRALACRFLHARQVAALLAPYVAIFGPGDLGDLWGIRLARRGGVR
jgi:hypothetical protein